MAQKYIMDEQGNTRPVDLMTWARWFETHDDNRRIGHDQIGEVEVSTVFLGLDHSFGHGKPLLFETMIFGGPRDQEQWRYTTRDEAAEGHAKVVNELKAVQP